MNRDDLVKSFDAVTPTEAQKERMLKNVLSRRETNKVVPVKFKRYGAALVGVAAVLTLTIGYMNFGLNQPNGEDYKTVAMGGSDIKTETLDENSDSGTVDDVQVNGTQTNVDSRDDKNVSRSNRSKSGYRRQVAKATENSERTPETVKNSDKTMNGNVSSGGGTQGSFDVVPGGARAVTDNESIVGRSRMTEDANDDMQDNNINIGDGGVETCQSAVYMSDDALCYTDDVAEDDEDDECVDENATDVLSEPTVPIDGEGTEGTESEKSAESEISGVTSDEDTEDIIVE